ncbi:MAG: phosphodiester glycosidase family protein [Chloroflexi bacterium]|nr:phosphodiester glycosidase family protein [Chloroflexota bacterium]
MRLWFLEAIVIPLALILAMAFAFLAIHPTAIPSLVDQTRTLVGPEPIAAAENVFYGVSDAYRKMTCGDCTTPGYWTPATPAQSAAQIATQRTAAPSVAISASQTTTVATQPPAPPIRFQPRDLAPLYPALAAPGEGVWTTLPNSFDPSAAPLTYKTFLHSDPARPYARVAIVAIDATRLRLHAVAGTLEPVSAARVARSGLIPRTDLAALVAAFNGGFKAIHGHYGMMVDGQTILPPQPNADTIAIYRDGRVRIAPWSIISDTLPSMQSFRQTPAFLAYHDQVNSALADEQLFSWGKSVSGKTVIWRSALGISADGRTLYYAAGESLTARRLAEALVAVGASNAAELDVNWSFERFLTYAPPSGKLTEQVLLDRLHYQPGMYVVYPSARDYFYLTLAKATK